MARGYHNLAGLVRDCEALGSDDSLVAENLRRQAVEALSALLDLEEFIPEGDDPGLGDGVSGAGADGDGSSGDDDEVDPELDVGRPGSGDRGATRVAPEVPRGTAGRLRGPDAGSGPGGPGGVSRINRPLPRPGRRRR